MLNLKKTLTMPPIANTLTMTRIGNTLESRVLTTSSSVTYCNTPLYSDLYENYSAKRLGSGLSKHCVLCFSPLNIASVSGPPLTVLYSFEG